MGNVCDRLEKVGKHGNMVGTCTQDVRKVGAEPKSNNGSGAERPRWVDYANFGEDVDDIGDGVFKDETCCYPIFDPYFDKLKKIKIKIKIKNKDLYVAIT